MVKKVIICPGDELLIEVKVAPGMRDWLVAYFKGMDKGEHLIYYYALSYLVGISVTEAVKIANGRASKEGHEAITTRGFCRWLAELMSVFFKASYEEEEE